MLDKALEQRVAELEKRVAELEGQVSERPEVDELFTKITDHLRKALSTSLK